MIMNDRLCSHVAQLIKHEKQLRSVSSLCLSLTDSLHRAVPKHRNGPKRTGTDRRACPYMEILGVVLYVDELSRARAPNLR